MPHHYVGMIIQGHCLTLAITWPQGRGGTLEVQAVAAQVNGDVGQLHLVIT
jgi:hypothetical protein